MKGGGPEILFWDRPGPFDGSTHDSSAADVVGLYQLLIEHLTFADGAQFNLFFKIWAIV